MVYLCLESFGGVSHDIPKNVSENKTLHLNPKKIQLVWKVLFVLFLFLFLFFFSEKSCQTVRFFLNL